MPHQKGDLSTGTLFAAKLVQDAEADPHKAGFDVTWIELGKVNNDNVAGWIAQYDAVTVTDYVEGVTSEGNSVFLSATGIVFTMDKNGGVKHWSTGKMEVANGGDIALNAVAEPNRPIPALTTTSLGSTPTSLARQPPMDAATRNCLPTQIMFSRSRTAPC